MADYCLYIVSDDFTVKNTELFLNVIKANGMIDKIYYNKTQNNFSIATYDGLEIYDDDEDEFSITIDDFCEIIQEHIAEDSICIIREIGHEKLRYINAFVTIIMHNRIECYDAFDFSIEDFNKTKGMYTVKI